MKTTIFFRQQSRSARTIAANLLVLLMTTAFFVMSLNLYSSSVQNLKKSEDTYSTIAVMELYGSVDWYGELTSPTNENYMGNLSVAVKNYDLEKIVTANGVLDYDLRARYAAYIEGEPAMSDLNEDSGRTTFITNEDVIRFTLEREEPVTIPINWCEEYVKYNKLSNITPIYLKVSSCASQLLWYRDSQFLSRGVSIGTGERGDPPERAYYAEQIRQLNGNEDIDHVTLYPGVEYIASTFLLNGWEIREGSKGFYVGDQQFYPGALKYFRDNIRVQYLGEAGERIVYDSRMEAEQPFPIARWEDVQKDPALKAQWEAAWDAAKYNLCSYNVCLTDDITGVPVFHLGGAFLADGRMITEAEYAGGAKVCMVSKKMAELQHWNVGDRLDMSFYRYDAFANRNDLSWIGYPSYHKNTEGFFDSGEYEIVGIFDQKKLTGNSGIAQSTLTMPWNMIFLPENAVRSTLPEEELPVHGALLTIWLDNESVDAFLADMDALGFNEKKEGQYNPSFTFYDQGYSMIRSGLHGMHSTARLLLILSALLLLMTCVLLAWFYAQNQKHTIGIFRMLGGKKAQAVAAVLLCALLLTLLGAGAGAVLGHSLSERVGGAMLQGSEEDQMTAAFKAYVLAAEEEEAMELSVRADPRLSALAAAAVLLYPLLILLFVLTYIGKEPRALLPQKR